MFAIGGDIDLRRRLLEFCIRHLGGHGALPDEFIQFLSVSDVHFEPVHIGRSYGFMRFLRRFVLILETAGLVVTLSVCINDLTLNAFHGRIAQVHAVGTHVRDIAAFVQFLSDEHGPTHTISEFTTGFLLQGGCCEGGGRCFLRRLDLHIRYLVSSTHTGFEEYLCILFGLISCAFRLEIDVLPIDIRSGEPGIQFETAFRMECVDGPFSLSDQPDGHTLNPSRTQVVPHAHFAP